MALPAILQPGLLPSEIEYLATSTTNVQIVPLTTIDKARFLSGIYGPFRPPSRTTVPLWLALNLKKKAKCHLIPPDWMLLENLQQLLQRETTSLAFAEVPFHYVSVAQAILDLATDDVPNADEVRAVLKDLRETRQSKISQGLDMINPYHLEMTNIAYAELCELRPFFSTSFNHLRFMNPASIAEAAAGSTSSASMAALSQAEGSGMLWQAGNTTPQRSRSRPMASATAARDSTAPYSFDDSMPSAFASSQGGDDYDDDEELSVAAWGAT